MKRPKGWEFAHLNVKPGFTRNDTDAPDERAHELFPVLKAPQTKTTLDPALKLDEIRFRNSAPAKAPSKKERASGP